MERQPHTARERAVLLLRAALFPGWHPTAGERLVWAIRGAIVLSIAVLIASAVDKTIWDWLELLIVPGALAFGVYWLNRRQDEREREAEDARRERELTVASQHAQNEALQAYLNFLSERMLNENLRNAKEGTGLRRLTRARTLTVLESLGPKY